MAAPETIQRATHAFATLIATMAVDRVAISDSVPVSVIFRAIQLVDYVLM